jgi:hypothetical protein
LATSGEAHAGLNVYPAGLVTEPEVVKEPYYMRVLRLAKRFFLVTSFLPVKDQRSFTGLLC